MIRGVIEVCVVQTDIDCCNVDFMKTRLLTRK